MRSVLIILLFGVFSTRGQSIRQDSSRSDQKKITLQGYIDGYYGYDFNKPLTGDRAYSVSMARHNEIAINLAYLALTYSSSRLRSSLIPGFGTYMKANYASEPNILKYLVEANIGYKVWDKKNIWIDAGILSSPYSTEGPISKNQLTYTRSFAAEYVPYYLSGVKLSVPLTEKLSVFLYLINGWQQIKDQNENKSIGTQLKYQATEHLLINWNTYTGNEVSFARPEFGTRYFSDFYFVYISEKWSASGSVYYGKQQRQGNSSAIWWQANAIGQYSISRKLSLSGRFEYFDDPEGVQIPITSAADFNCLSSSIGINLKVLQNAMLRFEGRTFLSGNSIFERNTRPVNNSNLLVTNLTIWF
jgi:hypothetical protein